MVPCDGTSTNSALDFVPGAICNTKFLKAVEQHLFRILRENSVSKNFISF